MNRDQIAEGLRRAGFIGIDEHDHLVDSVHNLIHSALAAAREPDQGPDYNRAYYEELREIIDGGCESMTHADAVEWCKRYADAEWSPVQLNDETAKDAERYRFLAGHCRSTSEHWGGRWSIVIEGPCPKAHDSEDDFDAAIDAAIAKRSRP